MRILHTNIAYYWRAQQVVGENVDLPPKILIFDESATMLDIERQLLRETYPRIVIHMKPHKTSESDEQISRRISRWAQDSVGIFEEPYEAEVRRYRKIPYHTDGKTRKSVYACQNIFQPYRGNRSCFGVCDGPFYSAD